MKNISLIISLHLGACAFLLYMVFGVLTDRPIWAIFVQAVMVSVVIALAGWIANIIVEAGRPQPKLGKNVGKGANLNIVLPEEGSEPVEEVDADDEEPALEPNVESLFKPGLGSILEPVQVNNGHRDELYIPNQQGRE